MKKFFGKLGKKKGEPGRPTPPPSPNLSNLGAIGAAGGFYVGYEVREKDLPKLHKAVWNDDLVKVKSLVKKDVNGLDKENRTPLHLACVKGNKPVVQELLEWHAKPNIGDNEGKTPLLKAVECKKEDCVMLLLQHTADVDTRDRLGDTAVHVAVKNSFTNILRLLIKSGADINIRNKNGFAPLHLAVKNKKDEVTKILLQNRADFDVMDADGRTPLMYACYEGAITQVKDLITVGADTQIKDTKGFNAEDIANQKGQHACSHLLIEHNNKQSGSVASTPRMPSISSRTTTPRQDNTSDLMFGLPATNMANDYDSDEDGTFSKSAGDDSWKSDADMSLSLHGKGATPKVNLAKALNRLSTGSDASDNEDKEGDSHSEGHDIPVKRLSAKSIQSVTSAEIEWSDEDENSPVNTPRKSSASKVSFIDKDVSEIHEITATESETDDGGEYQGSEAKRPKYDHTFQQQQNTGYTPTGLTGVANDELSQQKMKVENEYANGTDFMKDIGLDDDDVDDFTSTPDISEMSEPIETAPKPPENQRAQGKQHDSDWDSTEPGVTPRTQKSILKTSNRQNEGEAQQQIQQKKQPLSPRSDEETSEWDSDVEDMLDPKKSGGSNWDSSNDAATPRGPPSRLTTSAIVVGVDEDEDADDFDEEVEVPEQVPVQQEVIEKQQQEVIEQTVDALNHTGGSHISYVTTESHSSKNTVIQATKDQDQDQPEDVDDEDSEWDSDEDIDCVDNVSPPIGVSPIVRGSEFSVEEEEDEDDEESVSEWELERLREKERKQKLEEEAERRREEELERQREAERLVEQEEWEELQRLEQLRRKEEEEALKQKLEEEEALKRQKEEDAQRQRMEEEAQRQHLEEAHRQQLEQEAHRQQLEQEAHRQQLEQEAHRKQLEQEAHRQQLEEEAQRQEEEKQKKEQILKNGSDKLTKKNSFKDEENSSPRRENEVFEMRRVNLLSVTDFLKSSKSEIYKANVTLNKTQQKEGTNTQPVVEESLEKTDDLMSFTAPVSAPVVKETASAVQSSYSATPIVEETIQKEDKSRSYTQMKGQVEEGVTSFSSRQPVKTTNTKRDVEKSLDPSKEQKRRPMSVESIDITADDDDESVDMDHVGDPERQDMGSYLRTLPSSYSAYKYNGIFDDDLISLTSTEVDDSMAYPSNTPYGKDILANMNLSDPGTVLKLQDHMHEQNKRLDHERNARITTENKYKSLLKEKNELQKKSDGLNQQRANLEQEKLDLETRIRNLDYKLSEESEMRKNAETLLSKTKEQLNKKEEQYTSEIEAKQAAELQMRNLQMELRSANNSIKQLEEEKDEYQQQVQHEKNARQMQEQINEEQHRLHEQLTFKQAEIASKQENVPFDAENQLEVADEDRKHAHDSLSILRAELTALKSELEKERKRRRDEASMMSGESEELQGRIEDLKNENKMTEDALTKATMAHSLQVSNLNTEITIINSQYEKERASKEKVDAELESLKTRLQSSSWEVDKAEQARSEVERRLQYEKEEWTKQLESSQKDNTLLKDQQQTLLHRLSSLESKLNSVENELHIVNTSLLERTNQLQQCQKDLEYYKSAQDNYDQNYKLEKELNSKLQTKVESLQEKVTGFQHENLTLKQQLESLQHVLSDRSGEDAHEKFTSMLASLKSENEKARLNLEERNSSLSEQVTRLKDENRSLEGRRGNLEQDNQRLNREYTDMFKKLSVAEASHEVSSKAKEHLDSEKHKLAMDLERTQQKYETAQQKCLELQTRVTEITEHVKKAENVRDQARAELLNTSVNQDEGNKIRQDLEGTLHHIQIDNARLDAELKHERQRVEQLQKDLQDSQKVRNSLESLCSNLKSANNMLEDKREHVQSDNSMDVSQYEKQRQEALSHLEEERRKARKATEKVKIAETKLEAEQEKNIELQKELATMKGYLKMAKRKLKVLDTSDSRVNTITTEFDKERLTMEGTLSEARQQAKMENGYVNKDELNQKEKELEAHYRLQLNRKLDEINNYLEQQARARERLDNSRDETEYKIKDARRKLEDENTSLKIQNEQIKAQKDSKEMEAKRFRDLYDSEMQWRMRLSEQLVRTTDKAYGYKSNAERQRGRIQNNLSFSTPVNGNAMDYSRLSMNGDDILSNRLRVELDRSIAKHLEAAPHDNIQPVIRTHDDSIMNSSFAKSSAEYLELLKRKYCV